MEYCAYALFSPKFNKIYVGFTANVDRRLDSHNQFATKGWTIKFRPWIKIHQEKSTSKKEGRQPLSRRAILQRFLQPLEKFLLPYERILSA